MWGGQRDGDLLMIYLRAAAFAVLLPLLVNGADAASLSKPQRIVSLNMCLDELALRLADRERVASVLWMSRDPLNSNVADIARTIPGNNGTAEEAVSFHPDRVLVGEFTSALTKSILYRVGMPVHEFGVPENFDAVRAQIRNFGEVIGEPERANAMVEKLDDDLASISFPSYAPKLKAIILRPNGFTVGAGSLVDEILSRAGLDNLAARLDIGSYEQMPLERIAMLGADILIVNSEHSDEASLATEGLKHPLIDALGERTRVIAVPSRLWTCAGPNLVEAVRLLQRETSDLRPQAVLP
jgi:iron complex transport system substrate-binding protein